MLRILLTGSNGLLGQKIVYAALKRNDIQLLATSKGESRLHIKSGFDYASMDITQADEVAGIVEEFKPHCIINTAAMTNVDACEKDQENCWKMNVEAVRTMTELCELYNIHLIHLSTDFVFDGEKGYYSEEDVPNPLSHYARSKYESEKVVQQARIDSAIIRTIIIYGVVDDKQRSNVVIWTINSLRQQKDINVISDQMRSPTLAEDLADACVQAALKRATGIYHVSGSETMSILDMVNRTADFFQLDKKYIHPVTTDQLKQPAKRPLLTGFNIDKAKRELNFQPHTLLQGLAIVKMQLEK